MIARRTGWCRCCAWPRSASPARPCSTGASTVDSDARLREHRDGYGNALHMLYVDHPIERLNVTVTGQI
jgi:hypothetical protein